MVLSINHAEGNRPKSYTAIYQRTIDPKIVGVWEDNRKQQLEITTTQFLYGDKKVEYNARVATQTYDISRGGFIWRGIWKLENDALTLCYCHSSRPTEFIEQGNAILRIYTRKAPEVTKTLEVLKGIWYSSENVKIEITDSQIVCGDGSCKSLEVREQHITIGKNWLGTWKVEGDTLTLCQKDTVIIYTRKLPDVASKTLGQLRDEWGK